MLHQKIDNADAVWTTYQGTERIPGFPLGKYFAWNWIKVSDSLSNLNSVPIENRLSN